VSSAAFSALDLRRSTHRVTVARRTEPAASPLPSFFSLQRSIGNQGVTSLLTRRAARDPSSGDRTAVMDSRVGGLLRDELVQRQAAPAATAPSGTAVTPPAPAPTDPNACPDANEQKRKEKFRARTDMHLSNHIPSTGIGKYDTAYFPKTGKMPVIVRIHFSFKDDASAPTGMARLLRRLRGDNLSNVIWDDTQKKDYIDQFVARVHARWSAKHTMRSVKSCWDFVAVPDINVLVVPIPAAAHFAVTVHKSVGPGIDYKSAVHNEHLLNPSAQPTADFWQSDNREEPNFNSGSVATNERTRIEAAITAASASRLLFEVNSDALKPDAAAALAKLATALNAANPSAPLIPILIEGFASADGDAGHNADLARRRAQRAAKALTDAGVRQPVRATGKGPVGAPHDVNNRAATVAADRTFETTYATNRYSVSEHEFGHMLGNPDEYSNAAAATPLGGVQTRYSGLVTSAGLTVPSFGQDTSSQMSAGVDVLPEHYVTLWEALAKMTSPDLGQADWSLR